MQLLTKVQRLKNKMKLRKQQSISSFIRDEKDAKVLLNLSKEELIERYFHRLRGAAFSGFMIGFYIGIILTVILVRNLVL